MPHLFEKCKPGNDDIPKKNKKDRCLKKLILFFYFRLDFVRIP